MNQNKIAIPHNSRDLHSEALSQEVLKSLVGGVRLDDKHTMTSEAAAALTAGMPLDVSGADLKAAVELPPASAAGETKVEVEVTSSKLHFGAHGAFEIKLELERHDGVHPKATKIDFGAAGVKGQPDSLKVSLTDRSTGERLELNAKEVAAKEKAGDPLFKDLAVAFKKINEADSKRDGSFAQEIREAFGGKLGKVDKYAKSFVNPSYYKSKSTFDENGNWHTTTNSSENDQQRLNAAHMVKAMDAEHRGEVQRQAPFKDAQQGAAQELHEAVKDTIDARRSFTDTQAQVKLAIAKQGVADAEHHAAKLHVDVTKMNLDNAVKKLAEGQAAAKAEKPGAPTPAELKALNDNVSKAGKESAKAHADFTSAGKALEKASSDRVNLEKKLANQTLDKGGERITKTEKVAKDAHKDAHDNGVRTRSNSVGGNPLHDHVDDKGRPRSNSLPHQSDVKNAPPVSKDQLKINDPKLDKLPKPEKAPQPQKPKGGIEEIKKPTLNYLKNHGGQIARDIGNTIAKDAAKKEGNYNKDRSEDTLLGGVDEEMSKDGNVTTSVLTIAQIATEGGTESYSGSKGAGKFADWSITAEAGKQTTTSTQLDNGDLKEVTDTLYGGGTFGVSGHAARSDGGISAGVKIGVSVDVVVEQSEQIKHQDGSSSKHTSQARAHAEAGAEAGGSLGYDGGRLALGGSVEAGVSTSKLYEHKNSSGTRFFGSVTSLYKVHGTGRYQLEYNLDPSNGKGIMVGGKGLEIEGGGGPGVEGMFGYQTEKGSGIEIGGGAYGNKIGGKGAPIFGYKDGKLTLGGDLGLGFGGGGSGHIKVDTNIGAVLDLAAKDLERGNFAGAVDKAIFSPVYGLFI